MTDPTGYAGVGTQFRRWNADTGAYDAVSKITKIDGPSPKVDTQDTTALDTEGGSRTFIAGLIDEGELKLTMNFTRDGYDLMMADLRSRALHNYEIILPDDDNTTFEMEALVTGCPLNIEEKLIKMDVTLKISGPVETESGSGPSPG